MDVGQLNRRIARAGPALRRIEAELAKALEPVLVWAGEEAARNLRQRAVRLKTALTASDWTPPDGDEVLDVEEVARRLQEAAAPARAAAVTEIASQVLKGVGLSLEAINPFVASVVTAQKIRHAAATTRAQVMRAVQASYQAGLSIPDTAHLIRQVMREAAPARARAIARTEMVSATAGGSLAASRVVEEATGQRLYKTWLTAAGAEHPRHETYVGLNGQTRPLQEPFDVGGASLMHPGDPAGPAGEVINCRCTLVYRDEPPPEGACSPGDCPQGVEAPSLIGPVLLPGPSSTLSDRLPALAPLPPTSDVEELTRALLLRASQVEPQLTSLLKRVAKGRGGALTRLQTRLKGAESLARKIRSNAAERGHTAFQAAAEIKDVVRYTILLPEESYGTGVTGALDDLRREGVTVERIRDYWQARDTNGAYFGVNASLRAPNGHYFEVQFHTQASVEAAETGHVLYEKARVLPADHPDQARLAAEARELWNQVRRPFGLDSIVSTEAGFEREWPFGPGAERVGEVAATLQQESLDSWRRWRQSLTDAEARALAAYSAEPGTHVQLNTWLRTGAVDAATDQERERAVARLTRQMRALDRALAKAPEVERIVWRGLPAATVDTLRPGELVRFAGYSSSTARPEVAAAVGEAVLEIRARSGAALSPPGVTADEALSSLSWEREVLLPHNAQFRVLGVEEGLIDGKRKRVVRLEEIPAVRARPKDKARYMEAAQAVADGIVADEQYGGWGTIRLTKEGVPPGRGPARARFLVPLSRGDVLRMPGKPKADAIAEFAAVRQSLRELAPDVVVVAHYDAKADVTTVMAARPVDQLAEAQRLGSLIGLERLVDLTTGQIHDVPDRPLRDGAVPSQMKKGKLEGEAPGLSDLPEAAREHVQRYLRGGEADQAVVEAAAALGRLPAGTRLYAQLWPHNLPALADALALSTPLQQGQALLALVPRLLRPGAPLLLVEPGRWDLDPVRVAGGGRDWQVVLELVDPQTGILVGERAVTPGDAAYRVVGYRTETVTLPTGMPGQRLVVTVRQESGGRASVPGAAAALRYRPLMAPSPPLLGTREEEALRARRVASGDGQVLASMQKAVVAKSLARELAQSDDWRRVVGEQIQASRPEELEALLEEMADGEELVFNRSDGFWKRYRKEREGGKPVFVSLDGGLRVPPDRLARYLVDERPPVIGRGGNPTLYASLISHGYGDSLDEAVVSSLVGSWAATSAEGSLSMAIQHAAVEELGLSPRTRTRFDLDPDLDPHVEEGKKLLAEAGPALRLFLRTMYKQTQERLRAMGVDHVLVYRGIRLPVRLPVGHHEMNLQPLSSFTAEFSIARVFAGVSTMGPSHGAVIAVVVPRERILATPMTGFGCLDEQEVVVLGDESVPVVAGSLAGPPEIWWAVIAVSEKEEAKRDLRPLRDLPVGAAFRLEGQVLRVAAPGGRVSVSNFGPVTHLDEDTLVEPAKVVPATALQVGDVVHVRGDLWWVMRVDSGGAKIAKLVPGTMGPGAEVVELTPFDAVELV
ncbi:MAG: ADP-ribosyltransferase domain-containing protein [Armatimonadota bacterium]|nr:ADP-ribosyltransferase domain-containing protein [Armatimonadota bacterium]